MPINGLSVNTLKKDKNLSGEERIPLYTTTKSRPAAFTTVDDILAKVPAPAPSGVTAINGQTGNLNLASINGVSLLQNIDITLSASVNYANVFFVDPDPLNGNDSTGEVNRFDKPYRTYDAASTAALALSPTISAPALVVLRKGVYVDNMLLKPYVYVNCEEGVVFTNGGFFDDVNTGVCKIYGHACFYSNARALIQQYTTNIYLEFDESIQDATSFLGVIESKILVGYTNAQLHIRCNKLESNCKNGYLVTFRGSTFVTLEVSKHMAGPGKLINLSANSPSSAFVGTAIVKCPKIISDNRTTTYDSRLKVCVLSQASSGTLEIYGDLINNSNTFVYGPGTIYQAACISTLQNPGGIIRVYGNLYANEGFGVYGVSASGNDYMSYDIKGNIFSKYIPVLLLGHGNKIKLEGEVTKVLNDSLAGPCVYAVNSCEVYAKNVLFKNYNTVNSNVIALDAVTTKGYFYNCVAYSSGAGDRFLNDTSVGSFGCNNVKGNVLIGGALGTTLFTPQDYTQVSGLVLPNF